MLSSREPSMAYISWCRTAISRGGLGIKEEKMETLGRRFDLDRHHVNDGGRVTRQAGVIL